MTKANDGLTCLLLILLQHLCALKCQLNCRDDRNVTVDWYEYVFA